MTDAAPMLRFATAELAGDGLSVEGRIFPFGEVAHIRELEGGVLVEYDEEFLPGCLYKQRCAPERIRAMRFTLDHSDAEDRRVGYVEALDERPDGVHAVMRLYDGAQLAKVQSMLRTSHTGLSIEFFDVTRRPPTGALRQRRQVHVQAVTATPVPAYTGARVLALRAGILDGPQGTPRLDALRAEQAARRSAVAP